MRCYAPDPAGGGSNSAPPDLLIGFCREERKGKREVKGKERERKGRGRKKGKRSGREK